jgi:formate dehydrogenase subunit delta
MMTTDQRLIYMANQIARNFAAIGHPKAVAATADHIHKFWAPSMTARAFAMLDQEDGAALTPAADGALRRLRDGDEPRSQTPATKFDAAGEGDRSDAG